MEAESAVLVQDAFPSGEEGEGAGTVAVADGPGDEVAVLNRVRDRQAFHLPATGTRQFDRVGVRVLFQRGGEGLCDAELVLPGQRERLAASVVVNRPVGSGQGGDRVSGVVLGQRCVDEEHPRPQQAQHQHREGVVEATGEASPVRAGRGCRPRRLRHLVHGGDREQQRAEGKERREQGAQHSVQVRGVVEVRADADGQQRERQDERQHGRHSPVRAAIEECSQGGPR